ncbi:MAG TPA: zf-TFIIB domain-containing protein [Candidatus Angelobacter sp.]
MAAEVLHCPACGAAVASTATHCDYCGAGLATVACPSCFGMTFAGSKFCSHCGATLSRTEVAGAATQLCPRCQVEMTTVTLGDSTVQECPQCVGLWLDPETLRRICTQQEKQAAILAHAPRPDAPHATIPIRYVPCPVCHQLMNRVNFARASSVIVDVCKPHGTWFDQDELRLTVEFIRAGGMEKARARELAEIEEQRRKLAADRSAAAGTFALSAETQIHVNSHQTALNILRTLLDD